MGLEKISSLSSEGSSVSLTEGAPDPVEEPWLPGFEPDDEEQLPLPLD